MSTLLDALRRGDIEAARRIGPQEIASNVIMAGPVAVRTYLEAFPTKTSDIQLGLLYYPSDGSGGQRIEEARQVLDSFDALSRYTQEDFRNEIRKAILNGDKQKINILASRGAFRIPNIQSILSECLSEFARNSHTSSDVIRWLVQNGA